MTDWWDTYESWAINTEPEITLCQECLAAEHDGDCTFEDKIYALRIKRENPCEGCTGDCIECEELKK